MYEDNGLKVIGEVNRKIINFLDVTLNLTTESFRPYTKPNTNLLYINSLSNHPPSILKNIPNAVNERLCRLSSSVEEFRAVVAPYQEALDMAGYNHQLVYTEPPPPRTSGRTRTRNVTWFNPPFSQSISTNVGQKFLNLLDTCFPPGHELRQVINRNTVKVSYSTMPNMAQQLSQHNSKVRRGEQVVASGGCNCTGGVPLGHQGPAVESCPMQGNCQARGVVYCASVTNLITKEEEKYTGLTEGTFKKRHTGHTGNFRHKDQAHKTRLATHVHKLQDRGTPHSISWHILSRASGYNPTTGMCRLCLKEKFLIMFSPSTATLNLRSEIFSSCRHRKGKLLDKT